MKVAHGTRRRLPISDHHVNSMSLRLMEGPIYQEMWHNLTVLAPGKITLAWAIWAIAQPLDGQLPLLRLRTRLW
jgi:hypothetical protein